MSARDEVNWISEILKGSRRARCMLTQCIARGCLKESWVKPQGDPKKCRLWLALWYSELTYCHIICSVSCTAPCWCAWVGSRWCDKYLGPCHTYRRLLTSARTDSSNHLESESVDGFSLSLSFFLSLILSLFLQAPSVTLPFKLKNSATCTWSAYVSLTVPHPLFPRTEGFVRHHLIWNGF